MKRLKQILILGAGIMLLCSSAWVNITLTHPAIVPLPPEIHTIAIIDRTLQDDTRQNKIEKTLTGEAFKQDDQAVREVTMGIIERCNEYGKYAFVKTNERFKSDFTKSTFPTVMSWEEVEKICEKNGAEALLSIELFDSDFLLTAGGAHLNPNATNPLNSVRISANGVAVINLGIRIYYPATRTIIDEYKINHRVNFNANTNSVAGVANTILDKTDAVNQTSYQSGRLYGDRISPSFYRVRREFFDKPKKYLRPGVRKSQVADWKGAIDSWTKVLDAKKKKARRRAAYNISVGYEVLGDVKLAKEWASKAFTEYGEKEAKPYYDALVRRVNEEEIVKQQENQ